MSSQELEELQIKISKELNNRQLSTKNGELEKIKQKFIGKYIKYVTGSSTYVGYVKDITVGYIKDITTVSNRYTLICTGFAIDTYTYNDNEYSYSLLDNQGRTILETNLILNLVSKKDLQVPNLVGKEQSQAKAEAEELK